MTNRCHRWDFRTQAPRQATIYPDGCRDLLIMTDPNGRQALQLTDWDLRPRQTLLAAGTSITGYRLRPGTTIRPETMQECIASGGRLEDLWPETSSDFGDLVSALAAPGGTVASVARSAGVTPRSLQRWFRAHDYPPPLFWQLLGRARRAALALHNGDTLAGIAGDAGYSDQPHMTRALRYWFGLTPARIARDPALMAEFRQPALGVWTGEQISIR